MAHEFESGFFTGKPAWHGLGTVVGDAPSIEDALRLSGLDWTVSKHDIFREDGSFIPSHKEIIRDTDKSSLGVVSKDWTPLQNKDAFSFFDAILDSGDCTLEAAGSLKEGRKVWVLAKVKGEVASVAGNDDVCMYLLLHNSHDASSAVGVQFTPTRVVCWNTLSAAMRQAENKASQYANVKIRHTKGVLDALNAVKEALAVSQETFAFTIAQYRELTRKQLPVDGLRKYVIDVLGVEDENAKEPRAFKAIEQAYYEGPGHDLPGTKGTYWGAYNGLTHWLTHMRGRTAERRLEAGWFGEAAAISKKGLEVALQ